MMNFKHYITCIDAHTAGEPLRIVTSGFPPILWMMASSPGDIRVNGIIRSPSFSGIVISFC